MDHFVLDLRVTSSGLAGQSQSCEWPRRGFASCRRMKVTVNPAGNTPSALEISEMIAPLSLERIESRNGVCGGVPCVYGTRVPVWLLEKYRQLRMDVAEILEDYPF